MTNLEPEVIDLTESFTLANHSSLANAVIELDDSIVLVQDSPLVSLHPRIQNNVSSEIRTRSQRSESRPSSSGRSLHRQNTTGTGGRKSKTPSRVVQSRNSCESNLERAIGSKEPVIKERSPIRVGDCPICFERLGKNPLASTKCGHVFCISCLEQALRLDKKCPTCRKALRGTSAYHRLFLSGE